MTSRPQNIQAWKRQRDEDTVMAAMRIGDPPLRPRSRPLPEVPKTIHAWKARREAIAAFWRRQAELDALVEARLEETREKIAESRASRSIWHRILEALW